jgi:hypothetical protein
MDERRMTKTDLVYEPSLPAQSAGSTGDVSAARTLDAERERDAEFLTRRQAAGYIRDKLGRPMSLSTAAKLAAQSEFATPALMWGRRPLYTREGLRAWAEARSRKPKAA